LTVPCADDDYKDSVAMLVVHVFQREAVRRLNLRTRTHLQQSHRMRDALGSSCWDKCCTEMPVVVCCCWWLLVHISCFLDICILKCIGQLKIWNIAF